MYLNMNDEIWLFYVILANSFLSFNADAASRIAWAA